MTSPRLQEKEDWINAVGQAIVRQSRRCAAAAMSDGANAMGHVSLGTYPNFQFARAAAP